MQVKAMQLGLHLMSGDIANSVIPLFKMPNFVLSLTFNHILSIIIIRVIIRNRRFFLYNHLNLTEKTD